MPEEGSDGLAVLEHLYATQYYAPGALCCFAGRIPPAPPRLKPGPSRGGSRPADASPADVQERQQTAYTHALHLRFQSLQACAPFCCFLGLPMR